MGGSRARRAAGGRARRGAAARGGGGSRAAAAAAASAAASAAAESRPPRPGLDMSCPTHEGRLPSAGAAVDDLADDATVEARLERSCLPLHPMGAGAGWAMGMPTSSGFTFGGNP